MTRLHAAVQKDDAAQIRGLLAAGLSVHARDRYDRTPLHWAAIGDAGAVAEVLLDQGAEVEARAFYDMTPAHWASLSGSGQVLQRLLARGASPRARNIYGMTPLHEAASRSVVKLLLNAGAPLDARDRRGMTPLHLARSEEVAKVLVDAGSSVLTAAQDGRLPVHMAVVTRAEPPGLVAYPHRAVVRLRQHQASSRLSLRNVGAVPLADVRVVANSAACRVDVEPATLATLHPAQLATFGLSLSRRPNGPASGGETLHVTVSRGAQTKLLDIHLRLDARPEVTPEDRGMMRLGKLQIRPAAGWSHKLVYGVLPLILLVLGWLDRRRRVRQSSRKGPKG